jgi:aryl-alcohol dehydrogenase-like predicted oxidoreductase
MEDPRPTKQKVYLGETGIEISPMGIGTMPWVYHSSREQIFRDNIAAAYKTCIAAGINLFDTAEIYGAGLSETNLGNLIQPEKTSLVIASKFMPFPWRIRASSLHKSIAASLRRLQLQQMGLYQIHWPFPPRSIEFWVREAAKAHQAGLTRSVGVSNYNLRQTQRTIQILREMGIPLASNQVPFSLLRRNIERSGLLDFCNEHNVTVIAYSPLERGILTGKYTPDNLPKGSRRFVYRQPFLRNIQPLMGLMHEIGQAHGGKTPSQIALNWTMCKGAVPIPGVKNARQAYDNLGALGWSLTPEEVAALDRISDTVS